MEAHQRPPVTRTRGGPREAVPAWDASVPSDTVTSQTWDEAIRGLKLNLHAHLPALMDRYPETVAARPGIWRAGYRGVKADLPASAPEGAIYYIAETDHLYVKTATAWIPCYPGSGDPRDALRLLPGRGMQADAYMYAPGDLIADDLVRPDYAPLPGYRALAVGRGWVGDVLYTARACFTFDLSTAPTAAIQQVFFDIDVMEYGAAIGGFLDILPGGPGPTPLAFHHALDPALAILGDDKFRLVNPPFTTVPAAMGWDITPHYLAALPARGMILRLRAGDETTVPPKTQLWMYGLASAEVAGREPRLTIVSA
jgi:hypothetical protein